jgi:predicted DCC family thiol-disulfide oxidoreductase YuxK
VTRLLQELGGCWRWLALLRLLPLPRRDWGYRMVARNRYRIFGKHESCPIPPAAVRARFLDGPEA